MTTKLEQAARQALGALVRAEALYGQPNADIQTAIREALAEQSIVLNDPHPPHRLCECTACLEYWTPLPDCDAFAGGGKPIDHIAATGKLIPQFIPVGIVNDHHSITWMEEIVDDQAPIGAILYALQDSVGRNVSFAKEQK